MPTLTDAFNEKNEEQLKATPLEAAYEKNRASKTIDKWIIDEGQPSQKIGIGVIALSADSTKQSPTVMLTDNGITISSAANGLVISDAGIVFQGQIKYSAFGTKIWKGAYSENNFSDKPFTSIETVEVETAAKETAYRGLAGAAGGEAATKTMERGAMPIVTDVSAGPLPHVHTIAMCKHTHKIQPAYLYRIPNVLLSLKDALPSVLNFLSV